MTIEKLGVVFAKNNLFSYIGGNLEKPKDVMIMPKKYFHKVTCKVAVEIKKSSNILEALITKKSFRTPAKKNKVENRKRTETTMFPFTLTEDHQCYYIFKLKSLGPSFANVIIRITVFDLFAEDDLDPLVREICRT